MTAPSCVYDARDPIATGASKPRDPCRSSGSPPPPWTPPDYLIKEVDNCGFSRTSIRARYPALAAFASEIAFEDGDLIFSTFDRAERYYFSPPRSAEVHQLRHQLKLEASAFDDQFPVGHACRQPAWWALGANSAAPGSWPG